MQVYFELTSYIISEYWKITTYNMAMKKNPIFDELVFLGDEQLPAELHVLGVHLEADPLDQARTQPL